MIRKATPGPDEQWLVDYRYRVEQAYRCAVAQGDRETQRDLQIGGCRVRFQGTDETLIAHMTRALTHLESRVHAPPDLTVYCWSGNGTSFTPPSPMVSLAQGSRTTDSLLALVKSTLSDKYQAPVLGSGPIRCCMEPHPNRLLLLDQEEKVAFYWIEAVDRLPPHEQRMPLRSLIAWWFEPRNGALIHGSAVGSPSGGVLLAGDSGAGKSSTALACLDSRLCLAADDSCLVSLADPVHLYSLYNTMQVKQRQQLARYRSLQPLRDEQISDNHGKSSVFLQEVIPDKLCSGFRLRAILVAKISGQRATHIVPGTASQSLRALAPSTVRQMPTVARSTLSMLVRLVESVPSYTLELGTDQSGIAAAIVGLLNHAQLDQA